MKIQVVNEARNINKLFKDSGLLPVFIKTFLWHNTIPTDFDILFEDRDDFKKAEKILKAQGYELERGIDKTLAVKQGKMKLDLHTTVSWEGVIFLDEVKSRKVRVEADTFFVPSIVDDFLINCVHCIFAKKDIEEHDLEYLRDIWKQYHSDVSFIKHIFSKSERCGWKWALTKFLDYLIVNRFTNNNYRRYKLIYLLPFGLIRKFNHDTQFFGVKIGLRNLSKILWWKMVKESRLYMKLAS